uniref:glucose-6-phosphate dehydrogenase n=1 Tax=Actibacterium sp. TaxID=1872125 RepID=UPI00356194C9
MVFRVIPVDPFDLIIFGGTGDLAQRKIFPGLYRRYHGGQIPDDARIIAAARSEIDVDEFRAILRHSLETYVSPASHDPDAIEAFLNNCHYVTMDGRGEVGWRELAEMMRPGVIRAFYFSVGPSLFGELAERLHEWEIADADSRIVVEKPFGHDLSTARELNQTLAEHFDEHQIYRIDHYLGKETVQNLMAVRFANMLFEPLWNARNVDHIQITVAETVGVGGRAEYYDRSGAMRDMVQNHMMQLLCLIAMEPPYAFEPDAVRDEKLKVIRALDPVHAEDIVRGQYEADEAGKSYHDDVENPDSRTESFVAIKVNVSNWRWKGAPFYLRTGKRLRERTSEIAVVFKDPPHSIFGEENA